WIARLDFVAEVNGEILLAASDDYQRSRVDTDFGHIIQQAWDQADDEGRTVRIEARDRIPNDVLALAEPAPAVDVKRAAEPSSEESAADAEQALDANGETQTLENFLVGDSNRIAFGLARRLAMGAGVEANVVTIVGPHGVGKSHLLK